MKNLLTILLFSVSTIVNAQSPWTKPKGGGFSQLSFTTIPKYNLIYQDGTDARNTERYMVDNTIQSYNEIGLSDKWGAVIVVPFKMQKLMEPTNDTIGRYWSEEGSLNNFSNISLAVRRSFDVGSLKAAVQLKVDQRTFAYDEETGMATGYMATSFNGLYSIGKSISEKSYFFLYTGYTFRSGNYSDMAIFGGEYGHQFFEQLWVIPFIDFNFSLRNGEIALTNKQILNGFYINDQEYTAMGLKLIEEFNENIGATLGFGGAFSGNNVAQSPALSIGAYYKW